MNSEEHMTPSELYGVSIHGQDYNEIETEVKKALVSSDHDVIRMCFMAMGNAIRRFGFVDHSAIDMLFVRSKTFKGEELRGISTGFVDMFSDIDWRIPNKDLSFIKKKSKAVFGSILNYDDLDSFRYGAVSRFFHWSIAVLILGLLPVGFVMAGMEYSPLKLEVYGLHKSFGLLVFFLGFLRIVWRFYKRQPERLLTHDNWEMVLASAAHFWLYVCMIGMPLTGWLMSSAGEFPVPFFGLQLPYLIGKDPDLARFFGDAHALLAFTLLFILALHMAGALKHHVIDKDATLRRMAGGGAGLAVPALIILIAGASYGVSALALYKDLTVQKQAAPAMVRHPAASPSEDHAANGWVIAHDKSTLGFAVTLYGAKVQGAFKSFDGDIVFDPADLAGAKAGISIDMASVDTGDTGRDDTIRGEAWFDVQNHPSARFITNSFESNPDGSYVAHGNLTLRGKTLPVSLPFTLEITDKTAHMLGKLTLNRLDFDIGAGSWADEKTVGHTVEISIDLTVMR